MNALTRTLAGLFAAFVLAHCNAPPTSTGHSAAAVMGGTTDNTDTGVVGIVVQTSAGIATCSGSLILPNLVLTARHCVSPMSGEPFVCQTYRDPMTGMTYPPTTAGSPYPAGAFLVTTDVNIGRGSNFFNVSGVLVPPSTTGVPACGKDIAMLRLSSNITGSTLLTPRLDQPPAFQETFTAVGYGATDGFGTGAGTRRVRSGLTIIDVGRVDVMGVEVIADQEFAADTGTCSGDSGGPALDLLGDILGSVSRGGAMTCDQPIYTRVDSYADWIRMEARSAANLGGNSLPAWIDPPAPGSANFGEDCVSDTQCVQPLQCSIIGTRRLCTDGSCAMCPDGWICGQDANGIQACVPDPNAPVDAGNPTDAGANDGGDAGEGGTTPGGMHGGCSATPVGSGRVPVIVLLAIGLAVVVARRRKIDAD